MTEHAIGQQSGEVVYALGTPGSNIVKIGRTTALQKRLADIQRMSPVPLAILWTHPGGHELETALHRHFKAVRSHGEWFSFESSPVDLIEEAVSTRPWQHPHRAAPRPPKARRARPVVIDLHVAPHPEVRAAQLERVYAAGQRVLSGLNDIPDPLDRYRALERLQERLKAELRTVQQGSVLNLRQPGRTWGAVGQLIGVSGARAEQISRLSR